MHAHTISAPPAAFPALKRRSVSTLQLNLGYRCNQACTHCHVDAGPARTEEMSLETIEAALDFARVRHVETIDVTGGAPELNPHFRYLVSTARALGIRVIDRSNLTILEEPGQADLAAFLAREQVAVTASLPCYTEDNCDSQRGRGVFARSIRGLKRLNDLGYGDPASGLVLDLVYNPVGPSLPPPQAALEETYRERLAADFGIRFNRLLTLANMPIARFRHALARDGTLRDYLDLLADAHSAANLAHVMCRELVSVDWRGMVYDCDFNQMLGLPLGGAPAGVHISTLAAWRPEDAPIAVADHCYGCTAGQGSSCGGALDA